MKNIMQICFILPIWRCVELFLFAGNAYFFTEYSTRSISINNNAIQTIALTE